MVGKLLCDEYQYNQSKALGANETHIHANIQTSFHKKNFSYIQGSWEHANPSTSLDRLFHDHNNFSYVPHIEKENR
jgi:hypothetical protein